MARQSGVAGTDWTSMPETQLFEITGTKKKKNGKKKNVYMPWNPPDYSAAGEAPGSSAKTPSTGVSTPGSGQYTQKGSHNAGPSTSTNPAIYTTQTNSAVENPFPGSFATNYAGVGSNPQAMDMVANNPMYVANTLAAQRFGLPAGSNTANALAEYLSPQSKWMGILGAAPTSNADWINFGASLMNNSALQQNGAQLSPSGMMQNVVNVIKSEFDAMKRGGSGSSDTFNPITDLAHMDPESALTSFVSMIKGMLSGTMPDDILTAYANFLTRQGQAFSQRFVSSNQGDLEGQGANFLSALIDSLGPTLGL